MSITCPVCGSDENIIAIRDLVEGDDQDNVQYDDDYLEVVATTRTLSKTLKRLNMDRYILVSMIPVCFLSCTLQGFPSGYEVLETILIILGILAITAVIVKGSIEMYAWYRAKDRWKRLYYCEWDHLVFDTGTGKTCKPESMKQFLYERG